MAWGFFNTVVLLAAAQGFFLAVLLFHRHRDLFANRFLSILLLFYSIILLNIFLEELGYFIEYPYLLFLQFGLPFSIGPLHYLYAKYLTRSLSKFEGVDLLHFLPLIVYEVYFSFLYFAEDSYIKSTLINIEVEGLPLHNLIFNWAITIQGLVYMLLTLRILKDYSQNLRDVFSSIEKIKLDWLRNITFITIFVICFFLIENFFYLIEINLSDFFTMTSFLAAVAVYTMGYLGLFKSEVFSKPEIAKSISQLSQFHVSPTFTTNDTVVQKYQKSGLSADRAKVLVGKLIKIMKEEKPFVESGLTLPQLSDKLSISAHNLSEILNTQLKKTFFDFINEYRVEEVKKELSNPRKRHYKLLSIAFDAGFNSKTSFNTIFKKYTGMTPSEYRFKKLNSEAISI